MVDDFEKFRHRTQHGVGDVGCWYETGIVDNAGATTYPDAILIFDESDKLVCAKECDGIEGASESKLRKEANALYDSFLKNPSKASVGRKMPNVQMDTSASMGPGAVAQGFSL